MDDALTEAVRTVATGMARGAALGVFFFGTLFTWAFAHPESLRRWLGWIGPWGFVGLVFFLVAVTAVLP